jgi:hypothetical protein
MFCKKCGKQLKDNAKFCPSCGNKHGSEKSGNNILKIILSVIILVAIGIGVKWYFFSTPTIASEYVPIEEFKPAYEALTVKQSVQPFDTVPTDDAKKMANKTEYDIEETVRIINGLEIAQSQSEDFLSFLEYMAKQDYGQVAGDVIDAKLKLLPILQMMFQLQEDYKEFSTIWMIARSATRTVTDNLDNTNMALAAAGGDVGVVNKMAKQTFDNYQKEKQLKRQLKKRIDTVRMAYIDYLSSFAPVYYKYMKEWDKLCLDKDDAYLAVYSGRMLDAYNKTSSVLEKYPRNRETLLLKSIASIYVAPQTNNIVIDNREVKIPKPGELFFSNGKKTTNWNPFYLEADVTLDNYLELYPERSAPALVIKGLLNQRLGKDQVALSYFDQAAMEYPRQAEHLTDLLDAYRNRTYLNKTQEGQYLLRLYRSTMEGYGIFSPNFLKAKYYMEKKKINESQEEIFKHFFRRGNQGIYDCLLSDMQFCEEYLYSSFKSLLSEQSFIDLSYEQSTDWIEVAKNKTSNLFSKNKEELKDKIKITINNRSDIDLENVRVFLCIHYTDMYKDEYDVIKVPASKNWISHHENADMGIAELAFENKKYNDITRIKAILLTDNKICWIDDVTHKRSDMVAFFNKTQYDKMDVNNMAKETKKNFLNDVSINKDKLKKALLSEVKVVTDNSNDKWYSLFKSDKGLKIELPRILRFIDPVFSIHPIQDDEKAKKPKECFLAGQYIKLNFDYQPKANESIPLYIYSNFISLKVNILYSKDKSKVKNVEIL